MVRLQFSLPIKAIQTDWGGEFRSFSSLIASLGMVHHVACPHTHHQNGVVERKHCHIVETGLSLLAHASLPHKFWDHAFITATYLINRLPSSTINFEVPFTKLYHKPVDYSFLRIFGCACFPFLRPYNRYKLDLHSQECVFLGYSPSHKGYKCLNSNGRIFISKNVLFNEYRFPYVTWLSSPLLPPPSSLIPTPASIPIVSTSASPLLAKTRFVLTEPPPSLVITSPPFTTPLPSTAMIDQTPPPPVLSINGTASSDQSLHETHPSPSPSSFPSNFVW